MVVVKLSEDISIFQPDKEKAPRKDQDYMRQKPRGSTTPPPTFREIRSPLLTEKQKGGGGGSSERDQHKLCPVARCSTVKERADPVKASGGGKNWKDSIPGQERTALFSVY